MNFKLIGSARRFIDPGLVLVLLLTLFTFIPLVSNPGLPNGPDVLYHSYRAAEMNRSWQHGLLFPRWAEGFYFGYGSPLFHFYASLTYYITSLLHFGFNMGALDAFRALLMISLLGCGSGMYLFSRRRAGRLGAVIAGLVYVYSPYLMYTEAFARGTYPELLAFALFPWLLWRADAVRDEPSGRNMLALFLLQVALINAHNLMAVALTGIMVAWIIFEALIQQFNHEASHVNWASSVWAILAILLGIGAASSFWLPVLLESDSAHLENLTVPGLLDYRDGLVRLGDLLAAPPIHDAGAINGLSELKIMGIAQVALAAIGVVSAAWLYLRGFRSHHPQTFLGSACFALMALLMLLMILPTALGLWESLRPLQFLQFPWRLLGPMAACLAILAGLNGLWLERLDERRRLSLTALAVALPIVTVMPLFYVPEWRHLSLDTSIAAYHAEETARRQMGTTFTDEFRPRDVHSLPDPTDHLLRDYADGYPIDKLNRAILPAGASADLLSNAPQALEWRITTDSAFFAEIYNFYWLGWRAEVNGRAVDITPSPHHGLITFPIPVGDHHVRVFLGSTPARDLADAISLISIFLLASIIILRRKRQFVRRPYWIVSPLGGNSVKGVLLGGAIATLCVAIFFQEGIAWINSPPGEAIPAQHHRSFTFDERLQVLGFDLSADVLRPGDHLRVRVYWHAQEQTDIDFSSFLHLSTGGPPYAQVDKLHPGGRAISEWWGPDGYILDVYDLHLPADLPPGDYQLIVGLYTCELMPPGDCGNGYRPAVRDESGAVIGDSAPLATIEIVGR